MEKNVVDFEEYKDLNNVDIKYAPFIQGDGYLESTVCNALQALEFDVSTKGVIKFQKFVVKNSDLYGAMIKDDSLGTVGFGTLLVLTKMAFDELAYQHLIGYVAARTQMNMTWADDLVKIYENNLQEKKEKKKTAHKENIVLGIMIFLLGYGIVRLFTDVCTFVLKLTM